MYIKLPCRPEAPPRQLRYYVLPLSGQQYSVHKAYAKNAAARVQNTQFPAQVPQPQKLTRPTWEMRQGITGEAQGPRGRRRGLADRGRKAVAASEVLKRKGLTRYAWERYSTGFRVVRVPRRKDTASSRMLCARLMQRRGVRLMPARRPAAQPYAALVRAPGARFDGVN